jgi:hypothetical protein
MRGLIIVLSVVVVSGVAFGQERIREDLIGRLAKRPFDTTILGAVQESRDQALLPALRNAFAETTEKLVKQYIAVTIVKLGEPSPEYFNYLASFAFEAVRSPLQLY